VEGAFPELRSEGVLRSSSDLAPKITLLRDVPSSSELYAAMRPAFDEDERSSGKEAAMVETRAANESRTAGLRLRPGRPEDAERLGSICYGAFRAISEGHSFPPRLSLA
jgi:hypothetical protein